MNEINLLTTKEVATRLNVTAKTVRRYAKEKILSCIKIKGKLLFYEASLLEILKSGLK